jgi:hypothetical protein
LFLIGEHIVFDTLSSPGSTGRPSIPEPAVIEPISRGVLDRPPSGDDDLVFHHDTTTRRRLEP